MRKLCQIFVCATPGEGRCGAKGGGELLDAFREEVGLRGISPSAVLRNACTRRHEEGPVVFVYPDDVWYLHVKPEDVAGIVERHLASERLQASGLKPKIPPAPGCAPWPSRRL